jgi:carboxypeptidase C (cathepsin A)
MYRTECFKPDTFVPTRFESDHEITLHGKTVPYHTVCEDNVFYNKDGRPIASMYSYSYFRSDVKDTADRPVIFGFNGGPGSSSVYVHAGFFRDKKDCIWGTGQTICLRTI